jgi:hypothetical protein
VVIIDSSVNYVYLYCVHFLSYGYNKINKVTRLANPKILSGHKKTPTSCRGLGGFKG